MSISDILTIIGGFAVVHYLLKLTWGCFCGFRQYIFSKFWRVNLRKFGQWAVVTGATSGIGRAYACELAQKGLDIVLVSRSDDKLQMVAKEIVEKYGRKIRTIQVDFTEGHSIYPEIAEELQGLEIGILVNNVGMTYSDNLDFFIEIPNPEQKITQIINCNMMSVCQMTRIILPHMVERGRGLIINLSSEAGVRPQPLLSLYSATKGFVSYFSQAVHAEYKSKGIIVQCVAPFMVSTNMTSNMKVTCFVKSAPAFASEALKTVGHSSYTSGCLSHALQSMALSVLFPDWLRMSPAFFTRLQKFAKHCQDKREKWRPGRRRSRRPAANTWRWRRDDDDDDGAGLYT